MKNLLRFILFFSALIAGVILTGIGVVSITNEVINIISILELISGIGLIAFSFIYNKVSEKKMLK